MSGSASAATRSWWSAPLAAIVFGMEVLRPLLIAGLVVTEVTIWQWRMAIAHRGQRGPALLLGVVGAALQITAITQVVAGVHDPLSVAAYAGGVGCGVLFGIVAGERLTPGAIAVTIITAVPELPAELWKRGWPAVSQPGRRDDGPVASIFLAVDRRHEAELRDDVHRVDAAAHWIVKELRSSTDGRAAAPQARRARAAHLVLDG